MSNNTEVWKKASEVYADISELSPQKALAHVYGIKNITQDVRKAVITLINSGSQASQFYRDEISQGFNLGLNSSQNFTAGQQLDEYELLEEIGHGGMSQVFKAKRINTDQQTHVAIKVFAPKDNSNELLNHFLNEQKILAGLSHLNIVKMFHSGKTDENVTYIVMELIEGAQPLDSYCQQNDLSTKQKIKYIAQCAQALSYSHANLIIHRDLKPDNILINENKELKIVDFGIAKLINKDLSGNKTTIMALTPSYAAPEQINSASISIKTDIFSLAVVALDLLCKDKPLPTDRLIKSCANDEQHIDTILKKLKVDKDLKNILNKALEQEPDKRYSSMQSLADDLNNYLQNKPVNATSQSLIYRIQKFAKRRSALFATMISFMVFLLVGSILGYQQYKQIKIEAQKAQQVKQLILDAYAQTNPDHTKGTVITAQDLLNQTAQSLDKTILDDSIKFELLQTIGIAYGQIGQPQKAADFLKRSLKIDPLNTRSLSRRAEFLNNADNWNELNVLLNKLKINAVKSNQDKARLYRVIAKTKARESKFNEATINLQKAIDLNISNKDKNEELLAKRLMAEFLYLQSKPKEGIKLLKNMLNEAGLDKTSSLGMGIRSDLSTLFTDVGEYDEALLTWKELIQDQRKIFGNNHPELAKSLLQLSGVYRYKNDMTKAISLVKEAHNIYLKTFGENNLKTATSLNSLAVMSYQMGNIPKAIDLMYQALTIFEQKQSSDYAGTLELKTNLAALLLANKRYKEAEKLANDVYSIQVKKLGMTHDSTIYSQQILAKVLTELGQLNKAQELSELALTNALKHLGNKNPLTVGAYFAVANVYSKQGNNEKALNEYQTILANKLVSLEHPKYPQLMISMAKLYTNIKRYNKAKDYYLYGIESYISIYGDKHLNTIEAKNQYSAFIKKHLNS